MTTIQWRAKGAWECDKHVDHLGADYTNAERESSANRQESKRDKEC